MSRRSICITLYVKKNDVPDAVRTIHHFQLPDRIRIVFYVPLASRDIPGVYPVNKLRNIAIVNVVTTHFLVLDMDMWPVSTTYTDLITLPRNILQNEHLALILPAFSLKKKAVKKCRSFQECVETAAPLLPHTKRELQACVEKEECSTFRPESFTHVGLLCRADE